MNQLEKTGERRTILITISVLLISIHTIYFYHISRPEFDVTKFLTQLIRFLFTLGLMIMIYKGKHWARIVGLILFSLGILGALFGLFSGAIFNIAKLPLLIMIFIYSIAIYHFGLAKSFKAFYKYQNRL